MSLTRVQVAQPSSNMYTQGNSTNILEMFNEVVGQSVSGNVIMSQGVGKAPKWMPGNNSLGTGTIVATNCEFDLTKYTTWFLTLDNAKTVALVTSGVKAGQTFRVILAQDTSGSCAVTWWSQIFWASGTSPTLTTTAQAVDVFEFVYDGTFYYNTIKYLNLQLPS